jgi:CRISPR-associated protein Cmr1
MQTISATYRVTTPMFLGGAEQQADLRLPSFKGVLRFWWRALAWDRVKDVSQLRDEEAALFGSSDERVGQSKVLMRLDRITTIPTALSPPEQLRDGTQVVGSGARYLGYGVMEAFASRNKNAVEGQLTRPCFPAPFTFTVNMLLKAGIKPEQTDEVAQTLKVLGLIGGLGSKSRKGYGSLTLLSLKLDDKETWPPPATAEKVADAIRMILGPTRLRASQAGGSTQNELPEWTAFSLASRVAVISADNRDRTPLTLLDKIGREMVRYRSWGRNGKVLGNADSEQNFKNDHDLMKLQSSQRRNHPQRVVFGLPHNYGNQHHQRVGPADSQLDRRASPLFIHIYQESSGSPPVGVLTFLPSRFLPQDRDVIDTGGARTPLDEKNLWRPIHSFFGRLLDPNERRESFGVVTEVMNA